MHQRYIYLNHELKSKCTVLLKGNKCCNTLLLFYNFSFDTFQVTELGLCGGAISKYLISLGNVWSKGNLFCTHGENAMLSFKTHQPSSLYFHLHLFFSHSSKITRLPQNLRIEPLTPWGIQHGWSTLGPIKFQKLSPKKGRN